MKNKNNNYTKHLSKNLKKNVHKLWESESYIAKIKQSMYLNSVIETNPKLTEHLSLDTLILISHFSKCKEPVLKNLTIDIYKIRGFLDLFKTRYYRKDYYNKTKLNTSMNRYIHENGCKLNPLDHLTQSPLTEYPIEVSSTKVKLSQIGDSNEKTTMIVNHCTNLSTTRPTEIILPKLDKVSKEPYEFELYSDKPIHIFCDGSYISELDPTICSWSTVFLQGNHIKSISGILNGVNSALLGEAYAIEFALKQVKYAKCPVYIYTDSLTTLLDLERNKALKLQRRELDDYTNKEILELFGIPVNTIKSTNKIYKLHNRETSTLESSVRYLKTLKNVNVFKIKAHTNFDFHDLADTLAKSIIKVQALHPEFYETLIVPTELPKKQYVTRTYEVYPDIKYSRTLKPYSKRELNLNVTQLQILNLDLDIRDLELQINPIIGEGVQLDPVEVKNYENKRLIPKILTLINNSNEEVKISASTVVLYITVRVPVTSLNPITQDDLFKQNTNPIQRRITNENK